MTALPKLWSWINSAVGAPGVSVLRSFMVNVGHIPRIQMFSAIDNTILALPIDDQLLAISNMLRTLAARQNLNRAMAAMHTSNYVWASWIVSGLALLSRQRARFPILILFPLFTMLSLSRDQTPLFLPSPQLLRVSFPLSRFSFCHCTSLLPPTLC